MILFNEFLSYSVFIQDKSLYNVQHKHFPFFLLLEDYVTWIDSIVIFLKNYVFVFPLFKLLVLFDILIFLSLPLWVIWFLYILRRWVDDDFLLLLCRIWESIVWLIVLFWSDQIGLYLFRWYWYQPTLVFYCLYVLR